MKKNIFIKKPKYSLSKRVFSAGLAFSLLLNTACGVRAEKSGKNSISNFIEKYVHDETGAARGEVNKVSPVLVEDSVDENGNRTLSFDIPEGNEANTEPMPGSLPRAYAEMNEEGTLAEQQREYLRGHAQRLEEAREACRAINCDGIAGLDTASPGSIRVGRDGVDPGARTQLRTKEDVLREIERLEQALEAEQENWKKIRAAAREKQAQVAKEQQELLADVERSVDEAIHTARDENRLSESIQKELIQNHNQQTEKIYTELGLDPHQGAPVAPQGDASLSPATPYRLEVDRLKRANSLLRATSFNTALNDSAETFAELAEASAEHGQLESFDVRLEAARAFAAASQHKGTTEPLALKAALELSVGAKSLDAQGLPRLADTSAHMAKALLHAAIDVARLAKVVDLPLSVMEAFSGKTIDLNAEGQIVLRDCSSLERGFALGTLVLATGGVLVGAAPVAIVAAAVGKVLRAFKEQSVTVHGAAAGAKVFEETVAVATEIERTAPALMSHTSLTPYAKKHIWFGEIRVSADHLKVRIDGGLHTQEGLKKYLAQAPLENTPVSRELLPNGVERVVFPDSALTGKSISDTRRAAEHGFGVPNGKTLFPASWTPENIEAAIQKAIKEGEIVSSGERGFRKVIQHDGVTVLVNIGADGKVKSAFPRWEQ